MGVLFDKTVPEGMGKKPYIIVLEKYKQPVVINSINVSDTDDSLLTIEFDHNIEGVSGDEISQELGRVVLERIEAGLAVDTSDMKIE